MEISCGKNSGNNLGKNGVLYISSTKTLNYSNFAHTPLLQIVTDRRTSFGRILYQITEPSAA